MYCEKCGGDKTIINKNNREIWSRYNGMVLCRGCFNIEIGKKAAVVDRRGEKNSNYGNRGILNPLFGKKRPGSGLSGTDSPWWGRKHTQETKKKISESRIGKKNPKVAGENHYMWRGGITKLRNQIRQLLEYRMMVRYVLERDNYTCQWPGCEKRGGGLHTHHIVKSFSVLFDASNIKNTKQALEDSELFDPVYMVTVCERCHKKTPDYLHGGRVRREIP